MNRLLLIVTLFLGIVANGQTITSPFNGIELKLDSIDDYIFTVSGHFHGSGANATGYPTNTLLANLSQLNGNGSSFIVCLGDLFLDVKNDIPFFEASFFKKLSIPLFNTVGNHDLSDHVYQDNYGETNFQFETKKDLHLFFDTEIDNGSFNYKQIEVLKKAIRQAKKGQYNHAFIYCHRTIWVKHYDALNGLFTDNTQSLLGNNFTKDVFPLIKELSENVPVFWFSGSLGDAPASFFYHKDKDEDITYIATAIRGLKRDAWLKVIVNNNKLSFETISLTGQKLLPLESYDVNYWQSHSGEAPFNYRLIPYYTKNIVFNRVFWYGVLTTILIGISFVFLRKRRQKN